MYTGYERQVKDNRFLEVIYYVFCHRWLGFEDRGKQFFLDQNEIITRERSESSRTLP